MAEIDFENDIQNSLLEGGYVERDSSDYDAKTSLDQEIFLRFLRSTQNDTYEKLEREYGSNLKEKLAESIYFEINSRGLLDVLRKGISLGNVDIKCSFRRPYSGKNRNAYNLYQKNIFSVVRQLIFDSLSRESIDLALFLNGFLIATVEVKDQFSKQTVDHAIKQYKNRDITQRVFQFKRGALVHFAVDYFDVFMTTKLEGQETNFIPFNRDPSINVRSYRTSYLWKEIWQKDCWIDILLNFIQNERITSRKDPTIVNENIIFPRYHQWRAVKRLVLDTQQSGSGKKYLIEHSNGSGKSKTIAWLCYELFSLHDNEDKSVFDSVIVLSDRKVIVRQLKGDIKQLDQTPGIVQNPASSKELGNELERTNRILISTQQKFHDVSGRITKLAGKRFAIIVDEAQSSQGGESSKKVKQALTDLDEFGDKIMKYNSRNLSYFAFSGTPKPKTLRIFGTRGNDGKYYSFDVYSMKQAISEGFVLDVLKNYTTYKRYFQLIQKGQDKQVDAKKAIRTIMELVNEDPKNISKKSQFIIVHFLENVKHKIGGKAKAMIVTGSRKQAVLFKNAIDEYISQEKLDLKTLAAFSGSVYLQGKTFTEENLNNPLHEKNFDLVNWFSTSEFRILIVADKYRVGFDQPFLHTMYVDKKLDGVNAVQTLSRLNRKIKGKDDICVVDFVNTSEEIKQSFSPFYQGLVLSDDLDPDVLYKLYQQILEFEIITEDDLQEFWDILMPESTHRPSNEELVASVSEASSRFKLVNELEQARFKKSLVSYVENYAYLTQIIDYDVTQLEKLFMFGRRLLTILPDGNRIIPLVLRDDIAIKYIELKRTFEGRIEAIDTGVEFESSISTRDTQSSDVVTNLSDLILKINQEYSGRPVTESETLCVEKLVNSILYDDEIVSHFKEKGNTVENILLFSSFKDGFNDKLAKVLRYNEELYIEIKNNETWYNRILETVANTIKLNTSMTEELDLPATSDDIAKNKQSYKKALSSCHNFMWFADRFLNADSLSLFEDLVKNTNVKSIRILTSLVRNRQINDGFFNIIKNYIQILSNRNISLEVKIVSTRELHKKIHNRYAFGSNTLWDLPPTSSVLDESSSTFKEFKVGTKSYEKVSKDYVNWWNDPQSLEILSNWDKIKRLVEQYSKKYDSMREMYDAKCSICSISIKVPFIPHPNIPVYCREHMKFKK